MRALLLAVLTAAIALTGCNKKRLRPGYCSTTQDCAGNLVCDMGNGRSWTCVEAGVTDGPTDAADGGAGDAPEAGDASDAAIDVPFHCLMNSECVGRDAGLGNVCERDSGACVECLPMMKDACSGTKPICVGTSCAPCAQDTDCTAPSVCMTDGHCASDGEVTFLDYTTAVCPGSGSSATPVCTLMAAMSRLDSDRPVLVIRGPVPDRLVLNTSGVAPVIVGRKNSVGEDALFSAPSPTTAIQIVSDDVLIRDLGIGGGSGGSSKGIVVSGGTAKATLVRVRIELGTGLGIQADMGAELKMDRCYVLNNSAGGLVINGLRSYTIENSVFAGNGVTQIQLSGTANTTTAQFGFNTVVATSGSAAICDPSPNTKTLSESIVLGGSSCTPVNSVTMMPAFNPSSPYHLSAHVPCVTTPTMVPAHDIDGDPRVGPDIDCGADQFVVP
jgi:hypothetical protein